ncbi:hypothetical protein SCALM49S_08879 [Streptomyces californicus]
MTALHDPAHSVTGGVGGGELGGEDELLRRLRLEGEDGLDDDAEAAVELLRAQWRGQHRSAAVADALGWALHRAGESEEGLEYARRAADTGVRNASYAYHLGAIQRELGSYGPARRNLEQAVRTNPAFSPLAAPLARDALDALGEPPAGGPGDMRPSPPPAPEPEVRREVTPEPKTPRPRRRRRPARPPRPPPPPLSPPPPRRGRRRGKPRGVRVGRRGPGGAGRVSPARRRALMTGGRRRGPGYCPGPRRRVPYRGTGQRLPRFSCSRSIASNRALKLPLPKPMEPWRSIILAAIGLLIPLVGLGVAPTVITLTLYGLLPIVRNSIVGLRGVDPSLVDAATGIGMSRIARLCRVELPLAWPPILTGIRVSTQMLMGIAAIAAYASGPGLGNEIFRGIASLGSANAINQVLAGTLGIVVLALPLRAAYVLLGRLTIPRGIRA